EHGIARFDVRALAGHQLRGEDLLGQVHRPRRGARRRHADLAAREPRAEREQAAALDDVLRDRIVAAREFGEGDALAGLESAQHRVIAHELADVDVVARVNRRERARDREPAAAEHLALRTLLAARADAFLRTARDHLEAAGGDRARWDQALASDDEPGVRGGRNG